MDEVDSGTDWAGFQSSERSWAVSQGLSQSFTYSSHRYKLSTSSAEDIHTISRHFSSSSCDVISPTGSDLTQSHDSESQGGFDDLDSGMGSSNFDDVDSAVGSSYYEDADLGVHLSPVSGPSYLKSPGHGGLTFMRPQELAFLLKVGLEKYLLIDSRSFLEYNTSHIQQSANVCCSKLVKRRLQRDKVHIQDLLMQTCHIDVDEFTDVIVYDQCTENPALLPDDSFLCVLLSKLCMTFRRVALLKGGFLAFQAMYPSLCESKTNSYRCAALTSLSQPCLPVSNVGPTRILPFLYLGSQQDAMSPDIVQVNEITYVLNVSTTCMKPTYISDGHFLRIPVNDNYSAKLQPYFNEAFQFLDKVREANGCCLVHCLAGISRSPTLAIAYIMKHLNMSSDDAYRYVKDKRPTISPNFNFLGQLLEFEKQMKREREMNNNSSGTLALKADTRLWSNYVMDLSSHSPSSPGTKGVRPFTFDNSDSQDSNHTGGQIRKQNDDDLDDRREGNVKHFKNGTCKLDFPRMKSRTLELSSSFESSGDVNKETNQAQDPPFQFPKEVCVRPNVLNLGFETSRRLPTSLSIVKDPISAMSKSLTDIKETTESETPSPVCTKSQELTFSTSRVKYETRSAKPLLSPSPMCERFVKPFPPFPSDNAVCKSDRPDATVKPLNSPFPCGETTVKTLESPFPCGESTIHGLLSPFPCGESTVPYLSQDQKSSVSITRDSGNVHNTETEAQDGQVTSCRAERRVSQCSLSESKHVTHLQPAATTSANSSSQSSEVFMKSRGKRPLRSSLSLSLSAITPTRSTAQTNTLSSSLSGDGHSVLRKYDQTMCKIERKKSESVPDILHNLSNIPTASTKSLTTQSSAVLLSTSSSVTMSHIVKLKSFNLLSPSSPLALPAQSPTSSLAQLHFGSTENSDNETECPMDTSQGESKLPSTGEWIPGQKAFNENLDKGLNLLNTFKSTSLDKLNFTPCLSNSVENIQATGTSRGVGLKRPLNNDVLDIKDSDLMSSGSVNSSMNSSSNNSLVSSPTAASTSQKVVVRKREGRAKRTLVRPNSIAFSTYPTFDLGSDCQDSPRSSSSATSQDDSSEAYTQNGKKSKPSEYMNDVKFRLGRYSEREVYRQITAAMETAMLKTQVYEASRKSRSLDDILSSEDDSSAPNCESSMFDRVLRHCALSRDRYTSPTQLFEKLACGSGHAASEVYHSNSSLSSAGSHTSLHGSMELIQVS